MCPILDGYGVMDIFQFPYTPSCEPRLTEPAGGVMHSTSLVADFSQLRTVQFPLSRHLGGMRGRWGGGWYCYEQLAQFTTGRQPVLRPAGAFSKTSFKHRSIQIKGNFTKLTLHLYFKCIMYYAGLLFCSVYCQ